MVFGLIKVNMKYSHTVEAVFVERPNRFIAKVLIDGKEETVHVKNTGRCKELLLPGARVILEDSMNPSRKTRYDLISVYKPSLGWVNIDSQVPNKVVLEWLEKETSIFPGKVLIKPEKTYGQSRVDFYVEYRNNSSDEVHKVLMEVKGCTLEREGVGYFPDAPTERGTKHLKELTEAIKEGYETYLAFVIAMPRVSIVYPNQETDPAFTKALKEAMKAGVKVLYLPCEVTPNSILITDVTMAKSFLE